MELILVSEFYLYHFKATLQEFLSDYSANAKTCYPSPTYTYFPVSATGTRMISE